MICGQEPAHYDHEMVILGACLHARILTSNLHLQSQLIPDAQLHHLAIVVARVVLKVAGKLALFCKDYFRRSLVDDWDSGPSAICRKNSTASLFSTTTGSLDDLCTAHEHRFTLSLNAGHCWVRVR